MLVYCKDIKQIQKNFPIIVHMKSYMFLEQNIQADNGVTIVAEATKGGLRKLPLSEMFQSRLVVVPTKSQSSSRTTSFNKMY